MFHLLIPLRQRIARCFHALHDDIVRWMKPRSTSLLLGTITDLAKGRSELIVENALLRQQLVILRREIHPFLWRAKTCGLTHHLFRSNRAEVAQR
jgi:putative transposase